MNKENTKYIFYLHLLMFIYSGGSVCSKMASSYPVLSKEFLFFYMLVLFVLVIYAVLWQQILKKLPLITAYANKAVTVIWGLVWGAVIFQEKISVANILGAAVIILGVYFVVTGEESEQ